MQLSGQSHGPVALSPGKEPPVPIGQEVGWLGPRAGLNVVRKKRSPSRGSAFQPIARHYTDWVILIYILMVGDGVRLPEWGGKLSSSQRPHWLLDPPSLLSRGRSVKLTTHLHLIQRSRVVAQYLQSWILLHGVVLSWWSSWNILPLLYVSMEVRVKLSLWTGRGGS
jgi:hypothetical protein